MAILAAVFWGFAPIAAKMALYRMPVAVGLGIRSLIAAFIISTWLVTTGQYRFMAYVGPQGLLWLTVEALLATVVGDAFYFFALKYWPAGHVSLVMATSPVITLTVAALFLGEPISLVKILGGFMIVGGLLLVAV